MKKAMLLLGLVLISGLVWANGSQEAQDENSSFYGRGNGGPMGGPMGGMMFDAEDAELIKVSGTIYHEDGWIRLVAGEQEYAVMIPFGFYDQVQIADGTEVEAEGYLMPDHPWEDENSILRLHLVKGTAGDLEFDFSDFERRAPQGKQGRGGNRRNRR